MTALLRASLLVLVSIPPSFVRAEAESPEVAGLIERLGGASFADRESATRELVELGSAALPALREASSSQNLEVRYRSLRAVDAILEREHESKLQSFLDAESPADDVLPEWPRYRDEVGDDRQSRELFAEMQRAERRLFRTMATGGKEASAALAKRVVELRNQYQLGGTHRVPMPHLAAAIFLAAGPDIELDASTNNVVIGLCNLNDFRPVIAGSGPQTDVARRLLGCLIGRPGETDVNQLYNRTRYGMQYDVKRTLVPARQLVERKTPDYRSQYGLLALGKFGGEEELALVEKLLSNETVLSKATGKDRKVVYTCQVRDVALAVAIHMRGDDVDTYGFARLKQQPQYLFMPNSAGFADDDARTKAFEKFGKLRESGTPEKQTEAKE